jgi:2-succinyl-5-enolpyruvyl-6-hydroxy-3-cyclohexene-1-carboxylate synthase
VGDAAATTAATRGDAAATMSATLVDEWIARGARHAVISPGSRSTPLALALADAADRGMLRLHVVHDERSAAFVALGAGVASGCAAILACTSGTAAAEYFPAVVEASHGLVPMLVCTADRPPELQGVGAPQTIDQRHLYGGFARAWVTPGVAEPDEAGTWRGVAATAWAVAHGATPGPVQVNLPYREPLVGTAGPVPARRPLPTMPHGASHADIDEPPARDLRRAASLLAGRRGVILAGGGARRADAAALAVAELAAALGWPVLADPRGGARVPGTGVVATADALARDPEIAARLRPEAVLRVGAPPVSKVLGQWLAAGGAPQVVVTDAPVLVDPERRATLHLHGDTAATLRHLAGVVRLRAVPDGAWLAGWDAAEAAGRGAMARMLDDEQALSEPGAARTALAAVPDGGWLVASSSMPVRDLEWYGAPRSGVRVHANRGVNGIDGVTSTAVGVALGAGRPVVLLTGDLAFVHDTNGLWELAARGVDLRIVVIDNRGGGIFSFLPQARELEAGRFERLFGTPHSADLEALARAHGVAARTVGSSRALRAALGAPGPSVTRVESERSANVARHEEIHREVASVARAALGMAAAR